MAINQALLPEFDHEMTTTRTTLERIPDDRFDWKPHEKSMTMGGLATHVSNIPSWAVNAVTHDSLDVAPPGGEPFRIEPATTRAELLERFDASVAQARKAIAEASDEDLMQPWTLLAGGRTVFTLPRVAVLRSFVMNHLIHHRGQLSVYLRLNNLPVPSIYGPSADEGTM